MLGVHNISMIQPFWNRIEELATIKKHVGKSGFGYMAGRRRVGKTAVLITACEKYNGLYHQAVEGTPEQQLIHLTEEIEEQLPIFRNVLPKTWHEFFALLSKEKLPPLLVFDEFPYWVQGDSTLPSIMQKWIDHELPKQKTFVLVSGSSQTMLYSQFLSHSSPLYGRALMHMHVEPMSFEWFCKALGYPHDDPDSFVRFTTVGGIPQYWKILPKGSLIDQVEELYFAPTAILAEEPKSIFRDEGITGNLPKAIADLIGRGVAKPSEIASRLNTAQSNLSRPLAMLLDLGIIHRDIPFGESSRSTKRALYNIIDQPLSFYYRVYLPRRGRWATLSRKDKLKLLNDHTSLHWESFCRSQFEGSGRYWEKDLEIDLVAPLKKQGTHLIAECKWTELTKNEEKTLLEKLQSRFKKSALAKKIKAPVFKIFSKKNLSTF